MTLDLELLDLGRFPNGEGDGFEYGNSLGNGTGDGDGYAYYAFLSSYKDRSLTNEIFSFEEEPIYGDGAGAGFGCGDGYAEGGGISINY
jgi:hypothetical protein